MVIVWHKLWACFLYNREGYTSLAFYDKLHLIFLIILHPICLVSLLWVSYTFGFYVHTFVMMKKSRWYLWAHLLNCRKKPWNSSHVPVIRQSFWSQTVITWRSSFCELEKLQMCYLSTQVWNNTRLTSESQTYLSGLKIVLHTMLEAFAFWFEGRHDQAVAHKMGRVPDAFAGTKAATTNSKMYKTQYFEVNMIN